MHRHEKELVVSVRERGTSMVVETRVFRSVIMAALFARAQTAAGYNVDVMHRGWYPHDIPWRDA